MRICQCSHRAIMSDPFLRSQWLETQSWLLQPVGMTCSLKAGAVSHCFSFLFGRTWHHEKHGLTASLVELFREWQNMQQPHKIFRILGFFSRHPVMLSEVTVLLAHSLLRRACTSMMAKRISMHVLMFLVLVGALYVGQVTEAATVAFLVNASEWIVGKSQVAVEKELGKSLVGTSSHATLLSTGGGPRSSGTPIRIEDLRPKDVVLLKSGSTVPTDGRILKADTFTVNESSVTGEALPVDKSVGEKLLSGTVVVAGVAEMECTAPAAESFQGKLQAAVEDARNSRSEMEELVNRFAEIYTPIVVLLSVLLALWSSNLTRGLTVTGPHKAEVLFWFQAEGSFEILWTYLQVCNGMYTMHRMQMYTGLPIVAGPGFCMSLCGGCGCTSGAIVCLCAAFIRPSSSGKGPAIAFSYFQLQFIPNKRRHHVVFSMVSFRPFRDSSYCDHEMVDF